MDKEIDIWKQRNEILHKKVNRQMDEIKKLNKESETIFDLARKFPHKTYVELEAYRDADRQEEAISKNKGVCITAEIKKDRSNHLQDELERVKKENNDLFLRIAELTEVEESHRKINGKLQERLTEVEEDNRKMALQIEDKINQLRKS